MKTVKVYFAEKNVFLDPKHKSNWSDDIFWRWRRVKQHFLFKSCVFWNSQKTKHGFVSNFISKWLRRVVRKLVLIVITRYIAICHPESSAWLRTTVRSWNFLKLQRLSSTAVNKQGAFQEVNIWMNGPHLFHVVTNLIVGRSFIPRHFTAHLKFKKKLSWIFLHIFTWFEICCLMQLVKL